MEGAIETAYRAAREAWPDVEVSPERFAAEVARRLPDAADLAPYCTRDVYLAIACLDGNERAAVHLETEILGEADRAGAKLRATADQIAELRGHLRRLLFSSALADFTGRGDLRGYVKVIATRELIRVINRARKEQPIDPLLDRLEFDRSPELSVIRARYGADIAAGMRAALDALPERERALLRYALVDGWTVDQIGELYGVHRATAARWVAAARDLLADGIRKQVAGRLEIAPHEVDSLIELVRSRIDISLERIL
ncbi:MAG TPA: sigma factor-like helix-turn-helix DNA-binding protein [Kofleriaceae bacterium]